MNNKIEKNNFYESLKNILPSGRDNTYKQINFVMLDTYWNIGNQNENLFVSKYQLYLPTEKELRAEIGRDVLELGL